MNVAYQINEAISVDEFIDVLTRSGLSERRPVHDKACITGMLENCNLIVTARADDLLVGVSRSLTDFHYACYLSDLAVDKDFQSQGIGVELQRQTQNQLGPHCQLILLAAPLAQTYYPKIGYTNHLGCWTVKREENIG